MRNGGILKKKISYEGMVSPYDEKAREEMIAKSQQMGVPMIDINGTIIMASAGRNRQGSGTVNIFRMTYDLIILGGGPTNGGGICLQEKNQNASNHDAFVTIGVPRKSKILSVSNPSPALKWLKNWKKHLRAQEDIEIKDGLKVLAIEKQNENFLVKTNKEEFLNQNNFNPLGSHYHD